MLSAPMRKKTIPHHLAERQAIKIPLTILLALFLVLGGSPRSEGDDYARLKISDGPSTQLTLFIEVKDAYEDRISAALTALSHLTTFAPAIGITSSVYRFPNPRASSRDLKKRLRLNLGLLI